MPMGWEQALISVEYGNQISGSCVPWLNAITFESKGKGSIELGDGRWGQMEEIPTDACPKSDG